MKLNEIINKLNLSLKTTASDLDVDVTKGYSSDLLSDVIANAEEGGIWITLQTHQNIVSVAVLKSFAGIILVNDREPEETTIKKANEENLPIMTTSLQTFDIVGRLYELGISGRK